MSRRMTIIVLIIFIIALFGIPLLLKLPAFWTGFDFSGADKLATAISGFTAPVLSLISIILIFFAFVRQSEANSGLNEQNRMIENQTELLQEQNKMSKEQNEVIFILDLLNQLNNEVSGFTFTHKERNFTGFVGMNGLIDTLKIDAFTKFSKPLRFGRFAQTQQIIGIANSFNLIITFLKDAAIPEKAKATINERLNIFFNYNLKSICLNVNNKFIDKGLPDNNELQIFKQLLLNFDNSLDEQIDRYLDIDMPEWR